MTREEAIKRVKGYLTDCLPSDCYEEVEEIIKALEQESTKNDLVVDCISRADALALYCDKCGLYNCISKCASYRAVEKMPSVTPQPCEDAISRKAVINQIFYSTDNNGDVVLGSALRERIARLPSVTPLSSELEKNSKKLEKDFGESDDCISRQAVLEQAYAYGNGLEPDGYCVNVEDIQALPPVTPQPRKGHWIGQKKIGFGEWKECIVPLKDGFVTDSCSCSECGDWLTGSDEYQCSGNFCPNCGADMREVEE